MYPSGKSNKVADALSRQEEEVCGINSLVVVENPIIVAIRKANEDTEEMRAWHRQYE